MPGGEAVAFTAELGQGMTDVQSSYLSSLKEGASQNQAHINYSLEVEGRRAFALTTGMLAIYWLSRTSR